MRKTLGVLLALLLLLACSAAAAETLSFIDIAAHCTLPDSYIVLTPTNLAQHPEWLENHETTQETLLADWAARGVLAQAWTVEDDACLEITAVQDDRALQYYDIDQQSTDVRKTFRQSHTNGTYYKADGYTYESAEWKRSNSIGRFLVLKYKRATPDGLSYRGYQRRTIRNGYTITLDYQVYGRGLKTADNTALNKVMDTWGFDEIKEKPANVVSKVAFTAKPPIETTTGKFTVSGTADAGIHLTGVAMRMSAADKVQVEATAGKSGKFEMDVQLPSEGVWLMTVTVDNAGTVTEEVVFDITTYQKTLLTVNMDAPLPTVLTEDKLVISGKTMKGTTVQCLAGDGYQKQITTNNSGAYKFTIDTSNEGVYDLVLVFQKKGYSTRRFTSTATRSLSQQDIMERAREDAVKPGYSTLVEKIKGYTGRTLTYKLYITSISKSGDEWVVFAAMRSTNSGYKDVVVVTTTEEPKVEVGSQHRIYGTCAGTYLVQNDEEGDKYYPCIELLFWDD